MILPLQIFYFPGDHKSVCYLGFGCPRGMHVPRTSYLVFLSQACTTYNARPPQYGPRVGRKCRKTKRYWGNMLNMVFFQKAVNSCVGFRWRRNGWIKVNSIEYQEVCDASS